MYIIRTSSGASNWEFIADSHSIDPYAHIDVNGDGRIDQEGEDALQYPGMAYDVGMTDALQQGMPRLPVANTEPYTDQWGSVMTGYAPIRTQSGTTVALLAADVWATNIYSLTWKGLVSAGVIFGVLSACVTCWFLLLIRA